MSIAIKFPYFVLPLAFLQNLSLFGGFAQIHDNTIKTLELTIDRTIYLEMKATTIRGRRSPEGQLFFIRLFKFILFFDEGFHSLEEIPFE